ncbi:MAG TPA: hypothetical protein VMU94_30470 [Streptosporangiaceae bacterium]|nr:hypothetical protein [Streptosporangiaceae bacterium]
MEELALHLRPRDLAARVCYSRQVQQGSDAERARIYLHLPCRVGNQAGKDRLRRAAFAQQQLGWRIGQAGGECRHDSGAMPVRDGQHLIGNKSRHAVILGPCGWCALVNVPKSPDGPGSFSPIQGTAPRRPHRLAQLPPAGTGHATWSRAIANWQQRAANSALNWRISRQYW